MAEGQVRTHTPPPAQRKEIPYQPWERDAKSINFSPGNDADSKTYRLPGEVGNLGLQRALPSTGTESSADLRARRSLLRLCSTCGLTQGSLPFGPALRLLQTRETMGKGDTGWWLLRPCAHGTVRNIQELFQTQSGSEWGEHALALILMD